MRLSTHIVRLLLSVILSITEKEDRTVLLLSSEFKLQDKSDAIIIGSIYQL